MPDGEGGREKKKPASESSTTGPTTNGAPLQPSPPSAQHLNDGATLEVEKILHNEPSLQYSGTIGLSNDNLPPGALGIIGDKSRLDKDDPNFADDDGRTFHASYDQTFTNEKKNYQVGVHSSYEMLTQDGSAEDATRDRRADLMNNIVQLNKRFDTGSGLTFFAGVGVGAQTVGNMSGDKLQDWFHRDGGLGGRRLGHGLQDDYGGKTGSTTSPMLSGGVGLQTQTQRGAFNATAGAQLTGMAGLGEDGMSSMQLGLSGSVGFDDIATLSGNVFASSGLTNSSYLSFAPIDEALVGYNVKLQIDLLRKLDINVSPYVMLQSNGGGFADTTYTIGFTIGVGALPWLKPPR